VRAALLEAGGRPLQVVDDVDVAAPGPGQVRVRVAHCGLCHSDLTFIDDAGTAMVPSILGHEAAGIVEDVGVGVRSLAPGDAVMLAPLAACGHCYWCVRGEVSICQEAMASLGGTFPDGSTPITRGGSVVLRGLGVGGFGEIAMTTEAGAVRIDPDIPLEVAAVVGCAVQTGVGAVLNTARVEEGATVLVMGLGGIGISVVQGARLAGASRIVVSDPVEGRRTAAVHFGATDVLDPTTDDVVAACQELTRGIGVDYAFDAAGSAALLDTGLRATRRGGTTVGVGAPPANQALTIAPAVGHVVQEKKLLGCIFGSSNPHREVPRLLGLWQRGALDLDAMISFRRPLDEINAGFDDMRAGRGIRTMLTMHRPRLG
jgi:S-(hydroxymethyl)glutathione dehydrogenase / alcohol dehydrogenase